MRSPDTPLHEENPTNRFSKRAQSYALFRPDYPGAVYASILEGYRPSSSFVVADLGAGTGISSQGLASHGINVIAVEPNAAMRTAAEENPFIQWCEGSAEDTGLAAASIDIVTAFQAFHWFQADRALLEMHRILKEAGRVSLVWNLRDRGDPCTDAYSEVVNLFATIPAAEERAGVAGPLRESPLFTKYELLTFTHSQELTLEGLLGRARSTSYLPSEGEAWDELAAALREIYNRWSNGSVIQLLYRTELHRATRK